MIPQRVERETLGGDDVHVWFVRSDEVDPARLDAYVDLLSTDECARYRRFVYPRDRHEFLIAHALVRDVLSRYAAVPPEAWEFRANEYGRPEIAGPLADPLLRFNLSHAKGLSACVVALGRDVGVDVEHLARRPAGEEIAMRYFAPAEVAALKTVPEAERGDRFLQYWTLKEAYIKARGAGLSIPLERFSFDLAPGRPPAISIDAALGDDSAAWQFAQFRPAVRYVLAVAIRRRAGREASILLHQTVPLAE